MACNCHKPNNNRYSGSIRPDDQCLTCAKKHLLLAKGAWGEFCHETDNRYYCAYHVRAAIDHCKRDHRDLALRLRDLAQVIEGYADRDRDDVRERLDSLMQEVHGMWSAEHPDAEERLRELERSAADVDIILPLGRNSHASDYGEARYLLRSVAANCRHLGRVIVASTTPPSWLRNAITVPIDDDLPSNKDGNMLSKVMGAAELCRCDRFCVLADDNAFVREIDLSRIPPIHGGGSRSWFEAEPAAERNHWRQRCIATYEFFRPWGIDEGICWDTPHAPQVFRLSSIRDRMRSIPYRDGIGLGIYSCLHMAAGETHGEEWSGWVVRCQDAQEAKRPWDAPLLSYTDDAWDAGVGARLKTMFSEKSRYEK